MKKNTFVNLRNSRQSEMRLQFEMESPAIMELERLYIEAIDHSQLLQVSPLEQNNCEAQS